MKTLKDFVKVAREKMPNDFNIDAWTMVAEKRMLMHGQPMSLYVLSEDSIWQFFEFFCHAAAEDLSHFFRPVILSQFPRIAVSYAETVFKLGDFAKTEFGFAMEEINLRNQYDKALSDMKLPVLETIISRMPESF